MIWTKQKQQKPRNWLSEALANRDSKIDYAKAQAELAAAVAQLAAIQKLRQKR
jgi:F-type H+-transporting ATPase subunit epsilon